MSNNCCSGCECKGTDKGCMCANITIPLGTGHSLSDADIIGFDIASGRTEVKDYAVIAHKFYEWMGNNVAGGFFDALRKEFE